MIKCLTYQDLKAVETLIIVAIIISEVVTLSVGIANDFVSFA
ncbi:hypothetical protein [Emticicia sp. 17c]